MSADSLFTSRNVSLECFDHTCNAFLKSDLTHPWSIREKYLVRKLKQYAYTIINIYKMFVIFFHNGLKIRFVNNKNIKKNLYEYNAQ